jgi:hypothetical protein
MRGSCVRPGGSARPRTYDDRAQDGVEEARSGSPDRARDERTPLSVRALMPRPATRAGELLGERSSDERLHPHVVPHAELLQATGDAAWNAGRELDERLVVFDGEFHAF